MPESVVFMNRVGEEMKLDNINRLLTVSHPFQIHVFEAIDSTNRYLYQMGEEYPEWTVVIAETQTEGRGRQGREWVSPPGVGLWFSILLKPKIPVLYLNLMNLFTAYTLAQYLEKTVEYETGKRINIGLKWPNDLLIEDKKISGILLEANFSNKQFRYLVVGIGLNVNQTADDFPGQIAMQAGSLRLATNRLWEREKLFAGFLKFYYQRYLDVFPNNINNVVGLYLSKALFRGKRITVRQGGEEVSGVFQQLTPEGYLVLKTSRGIRTILSGDIWNF